MPIAGQQRVFQFVQSQAAHIESRVRMIKYGHIQYPELVGISREASPFADSILYYSYDASGKMIDLANRGNDVPLINVTENQHAVGIHWKGLGYGWSTREAGRAMQLGMSLSDRMVRAAFRIAEEEKERVFLTGDVAKGWDGILNHPSIPVQAAGGTWDGRTPTQIFDDINNLITGGWVATTQVRLADTLLLPVSQFTALNRPIGDNADKSILDYVMKFNPLTATTGRPLMIRTLRQLGTAAVGGGARAIAYPRDMEVLRMHIPQELQFLQPQLQAYYWTYYGSMVLAGLEIMEPTAMRYLDDI